MVSELVNTDSSKNIRYQDSDFSLRFPVMAPSSPVTTPDT